jgi:hypothetical protein
MKSTFQLLPNRRVTKVPPSASFVTMNGSKLQCRWKCNRYLYGAALIASLCLSPAIVNANGWGEDRGWSVNILDVAINWRKYRNQIILTNGVLYCVDEIYCSFGRQGIRPVGVDISELSTLTQHRLIVACQDGCRIKLVGKVDLDYIIASDILIE